MDIEDQNEWTVQINDGFCTYQYKIIGTKDKSIYNLAQILHDALGAIHSPNGVSVEEFKGED
jgi:hypothetical protein